MKFFAALAFILSVAAVIVAQSSERGGTCPRSSGSSICSIGKVKRFCTNDRSCPGRQKCCQDGCNVSCKEPIHITNPTGPVLPSKDKLEARQKIGSCPRDSRSFTTCAIGQGRRHCEDDTTCPGTQKCCPDGCNIVCKDAIHSLPPRNQGRSDVAPPSPSVVLQAGQKAGACPQLSTPASTVPCSAGKVATNCDGDYECPGTEKCCRSGCNTICLPIIPTASPKKTGSCPLQTASFKATSCVAGRDSRGCYHDGNCPGTKKCCAVGCNTSCENPIQY